ncbi:MAG TPA: ABC transporter permease [Chitinophagaceae bacterium]|nr:MAG: ABC-2 family transporter protein [Bacteroidetes bacterium OLB11]HMN33529.1 ABC transporter permease [Chitinophagaceae bacterium]
MMHLLKIEWLKIKNYKSFYLMVGLIVGLLAIVNLFIKTNIEKVMGLNGIAIFSESYSFPGIWKTVGFHYSWIILFSIIIIVNNIANEYSFKTIRQNIIDGMSRNEYLLAKTYFIVSMTLFFTLCYTLVCVLLGLTNGVSGIFDEMQYILYVFVYTLCLYSIAFLFVLFIKKSSMSIIIFFVYMLLENGLSSYINFKTGSAYGNLLPLQCGDALLPSASLEKVKNLTNLNSQDFDKPIYAAACMGYAIIAFFIAKKKIENSDL